MRNIHIDPIIHIADALTQRFPEGNDPFKIMTRLSEEVGELATEVNHMEKSGIKIQKLGKPEKWKIADEAKDVIHSVLQLIRYYKVEKELENLTEESIKKYKDQGLI